MLQRAFGSLVLIEDTTDHMPTIVLMKQTKLRNKMLLEFESRSLTGAKLDTIKEDLKNKDWNGLLHNNDCDLNLSTFYDELKCSMNKVAPLKKVKISWKCKFTKPWINKSIG